MAERILGYTFWLGRKFTKPFCAKRELTWFRSGGIATSIVTSPLDVLRTRLQSDLYSSSTRPSRANGAPWSPFGSPLRHVKETFDTIGKIKGTEGWRGLFRGLAPSLAGVVPAAAVKFYVYGNCKRLGARHLGFAEDEPVIHAQAAVAAGIATATVTNPIWLVKTRLQLDRANANSATTVLRQYRGSIDCIQQVLKTEGVAGFYRGLSASYLGTVETVIHLVLYERLKILFRSFQGRRGATASSEDELTSWASTSGAAGCAKVAAVLATYPHEVQYNSPYKLLIPSLHRLLGCADTLAPVASREREPGLYWTYRVLSVDLEARGLAGPLWRPHATSCAVHSVGCNYARSVRVCTTAGWSAEPVQTVTSYASACGRQIKGMPRMPRRAASPGWTVLFQAEQLLFAGCE